MIIGRLRLAVYNLVRSTKPQQITTVGVLMHGAGSGSTGVNCMAIFSESGTLLSKTNAMSFTAAGYIEGTLIAPQNLAAGTTYYLGVLTHYSSNPSIQSSNLDAIPPMFPGDHYPSPALTGLTDFASFTPSTAPGNDSMYVMGAR